MTAIANTEHWYGDLFDLGLNRTFNETRYKPSPVSRSASLVIKLAGYVK